MNKKICCTSKRYTKWFIESTLSAQCNVLLAAHTHWKRQRATSLSVSAYSTVLTGCENISHSPMTAFEQHIKEKTKIVRGKKGVTSLFSHAIHLICTEKQPQNHPGSDTCWQTATSVWINTSNNCKGFFLFSDGCGSGCSWCHPEGARDELHRRNFTWRTM